MSSNSTSAAALAAATSAATAATDEGAAIGEGALLFQDRLVEESGILGGQEIFLEDVRIFFLSARRCEFTNCTLST